MQLTPDPVATLVLTRARGRVALTLTAQVLGRDVAVTLSGGDRPHIGAVAVSQARPGRQEGENRSATTSVIALAGHREDDLARTLAARLAAALDATVCVACGIHLDDIRPEELKDVLGMAEELATEALENVAMIRHGMIKNEV